MSDFFEKYKDPRWQKKRLEIMRLSDFRCVHCDSSTKTLNVHHRIYRRGAAPWEYEDHELQCLCEDCHESSHALHKSIKECLAFLDDVSASVILGYIRAHIASEHPESPLFIQDAEQLAGVADFCMALEGQVEALLSDVRSDPLRGKQIIDLRRANKLILKTATGLEH